MISICFIFFTYRAILCQKKLYNVENTDKTVQIAVKEHHGVAERTKKTKITIFDVENSLDDCK